jgi:repressor LexA
MKELTQRQREVLSFIAEYISGHTYPPTIREIAEFFTISVKGAQDHVTALKKKGAIKQTGKLSRTIEVVQNEDEEKAGGFVEIPILGTVAAGQPILSEENMEGFIPLHRSLLKKNQRYFGVKVRGNSMSGIGIMDGDTAVIEEQSTVRNGEIVVAVMDEAVTLKRFFRESSRIRLQPENPDYSPIFSQNVRILGRLVHILRSY